MANLIITIISIALVAVAAIAGAWYGGQALITGQAKARAARILVEVQQVAGAMQLYASSNGGNLTFPNSTFAVSPEVEPPDLVPTYLSHYPRESDIYDHNSTTAVSVQSFIPMYQAATGVAGVSGFSGNSPTQAANFLNLTFAASAFNLQICQQLENTCENTTTPPIMDTSIGPDLTGVKKCRCNQTDANNDGVLNGTDSYRFYYRL